MTLYTINDRNDNRIKGDTVFLSSQQATMGAMFLSIGGGDNFYTIASHKVNLKGDFDKVFYVEVYTGYTLDEKTNTRKPNYIQSTFFKTRSEAKESKLWKDAVKKSSSDPAKYIISSYMIANYQDDGIDNRPFFDGEESLNKFTATIKKLKIK